MICFPYLHSSLLHYFQLADLNDTIDSLKDVSFLNTLDVRGNAFGEPEYLHALFGRSNTPNSTGMQYLAFDNPDYLVAGIPASVSGRSKGHTHPLFANTRPGTAGTKSTGNSTSQYVMQLKERLREEFLVALPLLITLDGVEITAEEKVLAINHKSLSSYLPPEV